jgi:ABC-2 type transport system ATP-binding protein
MLTATDLVKHYGQHVAVNGISLEVRAGEILGLLGPNGAGKSTTVGLLAGLLVADGGSVRVGAGPVPGAAPSAQDVNSIKRHIGLVPQDLALYETLGARDNLQHFGALYGLQGPLLRERCDAALALVGLADRATDRVDSFSGGMKRRLNIACALVHDPDVLLLDEPTVGVDPQSRNAIFENLEQLRQRGKAIIYTTHYMEEIERLADRIVIIDHGHVIAAGTLAELLLRLPGEQYLDLGLEGPAPLERLRALPGIRDCSARPNGVRVVAQDLQASLPGLLDALAASGARLTSMATRRATLEDVFLTLTGHALRD